MRYRLSTLQSYAHTVSYRFFQHSALINRYY
jgi:hypothetical protein